VRGEGSAAVEQEQQDEEYRIDEAIVLVNEKPKTAEQ
jgi:hypothetical protein